MKFLDALRLSGKEVLPLIEGGKGIGVSNGESAGAFAAAGGVGTFSGVNADAYDEEGRYIPLIYKGKTRRERHEELILHAIKGGISQARIAFERAQGMGRLHMNVLWEMGGCIPILEGILKGAKGLIHGITCGAGMPFKLAEIASRHRVQYYPIVSSSRAFRALWRRAYHKFRESLGGVVYEDPWRAGGHNGLSTAENPQAPEPPFERVRLLRSQMREYGLGDVPIIMAGGVWYLKDWEDWIGHPDLGPVAFQFGTRPLLTKESPISEGWKKKLLTLTKGDVFLNKFSPTGFYSSAVKNDFLQNLIDRSKRQVVYSSEPTPEKNAMMPHGPRARPLYMSPQDLEACLAWQQEGYSEGLKTPDQTLIFVTPEEAAIIHKDQVDCMGCLSACGFSNWRQEEPYTTGKKPDPRSFCIQKTLQNMAHGGDVMQNLMFAGHNAYMFSKDPFYKGGFIPTVKQLVDRLLTGY